MAASVPDWMVVMASSSSGSSQRPHLSNPLHRLHPRRVTNRREIRELLGAVQRNDVRICGGFTKQIEREIASIVTIGETSILLQLISFDSASKDRIILSFMLEGRSFLFETRVLERISTDRMKVAFPAEIYARERRARDRVPYKPQMGRVTIGHDEFMTDRVSVVDISPDGLGLEVPSELAPRVARRSEIVVRGLSGMDGWTGIVRNSAASARDGWLRIGLDVSAVRSNRLQCFDIQQLEERDVIRRASEFINVALGQAGLAFDRAKRKVGLTGGSEALDLVEFHDRQGRRLAGIVDSWGPRAGSTAVIIPPAWGRTKETLLALAATIVTSFRKADAPVTVLRFDGINKRGESFQGGEPTQVGKDQRRFTFSQGVEDIHAATDYLLTDRRGRPGHIVVVSFSAASIEARRAVAESRVIDGWVCVVGSADLQSMMRSISGGVDFALGLERGVRFGLQEILGVTVDMDLAGSDALRRDLVYLSDARHDMSGIKVPITWISGRYDAWMDEERVRDVLSRGDTSRRKFVQVPTGHVLRSSREAMRVFQLIAREIGAMSGLGRIESAIPNFAWLERRRHRELDRVRDRSVDLRRFWADYLLGRDRSIGFELMTLTSAYSELMSIQIHGLCLKPGSWVLDLGAGTGAFPIALYRSYQRRSSVHVVELDFVRDGLKRARARLGDSGWVSFLEGNVDVRKEFIPLASQSFDAVLISLVLSYVTDPKRTLAEAHRLLRPGGRIVVSSLRRDADMSKLFSDGLSELRKVWDEELRELVPGVEFEQATRAYMNEAARLLELEEAGHFQFFDARELARILRSQGFEVDEISRGLGRPPQASIVSAIRL